MTAMRIARSSSIESKTYIETRATSRAARSARRHISYPQTRSRANKRNKRFLSSQTRLLKRVCSSHRFRLGANGDARMPIAIARRRSSVPGLRVSSSAGLCGLAAPRDARSDARERVRGVTDA